VKIAMDTRQDFTGSHMVVLPVDYLNSVEAACELHEDTVAAVAANLNIPGLQPSAAQRLFRFAIAVLGAWLIPAMWLTCS
jgi:hypothetical protein